MLRQWWQMLLAAVMASAACTWFLQHRPAPASTVFSGDWRDEQETAVALRVYVVDDLVQREIELSAIARSLAGGTELDDSKAAEDLLVSEVSEFVGRRGSARMFSHRLCVMASVSDQRKVELALALLRRSR
jgi:hypothetical protein